MSVHPLDKFLNNVFDMYAVPGFTTDFNYSKEEQFEVLKNTLVCQLHLVQD